MLTSRKTRTSLDDGSDEPQHPRWTHVGAICWHCRNPMGDDVGIAWTGPQGRRAPTSGIIYLHSACAVDFALRLLRDVHEIECETHTKVALIADIGT